jgi:hypothetical protein
MRSTHLKAHLQSLLHNIKIPKINEGGPATPGIFSGCSVVRVPGCRMLRCWVGETQNNGGMRMGRRIQQGDRIQNRINQIKQQQRIL